ncbi:MAG: DUF1858 domain-containing protein [Bacteroidales bacterium]
MTHNLIITPTTRILDLITEYPQLEEVLFALSPAFKQLKNPLLRKTVARVTTLQQAAMVGGLKVEDLVNRLRQATGTQGPLDIAVETDNYPSLHAAPAWFSIEKVVQSLDAREMLNRGEHPVGQVLADLHKLGEGSIYELVAPFFPAPLIEKAAAIGYLHYTIELNPEEFRIYFIRTRRLGIDR